MLSQLTDVSVVAQVPQIRLRHRQNDKNPMVQGSNTMNQGILLACAFSTAAMTGLIWLIQVVQYPLMAEVGAEQFVRYEQEHCNRITPVVMPLMTVELLTALWLAWKPVPGYAGTLWLATVGVLAIWASTFFIQVPVHNRLCVAFDADLHRRLVQSNWIRTVLWSVRSVLMFRVLLGLCGKEG